MTGFVQSVKFEGEFEGDKVVAVFAPLSFEDALAYEDIQVSPDDDSPGAMRRARNKYATRIAMELGKLLPKYSRSFQGVVDAEGKPLTIQEVCSLAYFGPLVTDMGGALIRAAYPARPSKPDAASGS